MGAGKNWLRIDGSDGWTIGPERMVELIGWNGWLRRLIGMDKETVNG